MNELGSSLARLGGADPAVLRRVPSTRGRFIQMGIVLLSTAVLAVVSMYFALNDALQLKAWEAIPFALGWGFIILNLDRLLIQHMEARSTIGRTLLMVAPRIVMAALLGIVISTPLVLRVFADDIRARMVEVNTQQAAKFGTDLNKTAQAVELTKVRQQIAADKNILEGNVPGVQTPDLEATQSRLKDAEATYQHRAQAAAVIYERMQCELYGSTCRDASGRNGDGPLYQALKQEYVDAVAQRDQAAQERARAQQAVNEALANANRQNQAALTDAQSRAKAELPSLQTKAQELQKLTDNQMNEGSRNIADGVGLLSQVRALHNLSTRSWTAGISHGAVALLFFMVELLPITVKTMTLFGPKSLYDRIRELEEAGQLDGARVRRNDERRQLEAETKKRREVEDDMRRREQELGIRANGHVADQMGSILDVALQKWKQDVDRTLAQARPSGHPQGTTGTAGTSGPGGATTSTTASPSAAAETPPCHVSANAASTSTAAPMSGTRVSSPNTPSNLSTCASGSEGPAADPPAQTAVHRNHNLPDRGKL